MDNLRIGVIYWERTGSSNTYFGHHISKSLSPSKYRDRTPFYADVISKEEIAFHKTTQEEFDVELQYAIDAGIDYFAYTWNSDEKENRMDFPQGTCEQIKNQLDEEDNCRRKLHTKSALKNKIKLCAILLCGNSFSDNDIEKLIHETKQDYYEKIDSRPLIYLYGGYRTDFIERLKKSAEKNNSPEPYIAFIDNGAISENNDYSMANAVSGYSYAEKNLTSYSEFCKSLIEKNEDRKKFGLDIIPLFSLGWNAYPRVYNTVPWYQTYDTSKFSPVPTDQELKDNAIAFGKWYNENMKHIKNQHVIVFAWNEFEEGAWLCPTYTNDLNLNFSRIKTFAQITNIWKSND